MPLNGVRYENNIIRFVFHICVENRLDGHNTGGREISEDSCKNLGNRKMSVVWDMALGMESSGWI